MPSESSLTDHPCRVTRPRASFSDWVEGARLRTLPAAAAPVILGSAAAAKLGNFQPGLALLCLVVALALQVGVNYANDYSDGIRGTDDIRTGPPRLTGGGLASPRAVFGAMLICFAIAGVAGLILLWASASWWLLIPGVAAVAAAWFYTGGKNPYGYLGLGEIFVFIFFGLLATVGTVWVQAHTAPWWVWAAASGVGLESCALLMVNNLRDIPTDIQSGKRTLAVRLGEPGARGAFISLVWIGVGLLVTSLANLGDVLKALPLLVAPLPVVIPVWRGARGRDLIAVLRNTGFLTLVSAIYVAVLYWLA